MFSRNPILPFIFCGLRFLLYTVISNKVHGQLCWCIDSMNIVFTFLYAVFYKCHHPLGFLRCEEFLDQWASHNCVWKKSSPWRVFFHCF